MNDDGNSADACTMMVDYVASEPTLCPCGCGGFADSHRGYGGFVIRSWLELRSFLLRTVSWSLTMYQYGCVRSVMEVVSRMNTPSWRTPGLEQNVLDSFSTDRRLGVLPSDGTLRNGIRKAVLEELSVCLEEFSLAVNINAIGAKDSLTFGTAADFPRDFVRVVSPSEYICAYFACSKIWQAFSSYRLNRSLQLIQVQECLYCSFSVDFDEMDRTSPLHFCSCRKYWGRAFSRNRYKYGRIG